MMDDILTNKEARLILAWIYCWRGLELSILTHAVGIVVIYIGVAAFL
jgi:hypothetical protein